MIYINLNLKQYNMGIIGVKVTNEFHEELKNRLPSQQLLTQEIAAEYVMKHSTLHGYRSNLEYYLWDDSGKVIIVNKSLLIFTDSLKSYLEKESWESAFVRYNKIQGAILQLNRAIMDAGESSLEVPPCDFCRYFTCFYESNPNCPVVSVAGRCSRKGSLWNNLHKGLHNVDLLCKDLLCTIEQQLCQDEETFEKINKSKALFAQRLSYLKEEKE